MDNIHVLVKKLDKALDKTDKSFVRRFIGNLNIELNQYLIDENLEEPNNIYGFLHKDDLETRKNKGGGGGTDFMQIANFPPPGIKGGGKKLAKKLASEEKKTQLQQLYIAYFGRPADPTGLDYWTQPGITSSGFADDMSAQPEFQSAYGSLDTEDQVNQIYKNLFGREADDAGLQYWTNEINLGNLQLAEIANELIYNANGDDLTTLTNKTLAAIDYTDKVGESPDAMLVYASYHPEAISYQGDEAKEFMATIDNNTTHTKEGIENSINKMIKEGQGDLRLSGVGDYKWKKGESKSKDHNSFWDAFGGEPPSMGKMGKGVGDKSFLSEFKSFKGGSAQPPGSNDFLVNELTDFEALNYIASNPELIQIFGTDTSAAKSHYVNYGYIEGRAKDNFDEWGYLASNPELISVFGSDTTKAVKHYISYGYGEGRKTNIFNAESYLNNNPELKNAFGNDEKLATKHYVEYGFKEGRVAR